MRLLEIEEIVYALEKTVKAFNNKICPYGGELIKELANNYQLVSASDEDNPEAELASVACVSTISKIVSIMLKNKYDINTFEPFIIPLINDILKTDGSDSIDEGIYLLTILTFYYPTISEKIWNFFPVLIDNCIGTNEEIKDNEAIKEQGSWLFEILIKLYPIFHNFITKNPEQFIRGSINNCNYIDLMLKTILRIIEISKANQSALDELIAIKLIIDIIESLKNKIDNVFQELLSGLIFELNNAKMKELKNKIIIGISISFYYSSYLTCDILIKKNFLENYFTELSNLIKKIKNSNDIKRVLIGICFLLHSQQFPEVINNKIQTLLSLCFELFIQLHYNNQKKIQKPLIDIDNKLDAESIIHKIYPNPDKNGSDDEDDDDENDSDYEIEKDEMLVECEELEYASPLIQIDEFNLYKELNLFFRSKNPLAYNLFLASLDANKKAILEQLMGQSNEQKLEK